MASTASASTTDIPKDAEEASVLSSISLQNLTILEAWDAENDTPEYITFYHVTKDEEVYFGQSTKKKREMTIEDYRNALCRIDDSEIYPEVPADTKLKIAHHDAGEPIYIKRPGLESYETTKGTDFARNALLDEVLIMEQISQTPHPNIIRYHGCYTRRGRITAIVLQRHEYTLVQYAQNPGFKNIDIDEFLKALESAVAYLHAIGLAHNDINPYNIMLKENDAPVLIDFGSCQPFGRQLRSAGTPGWCAEPFSTSEKEHDIYPLRKLKTWLLKPE
ncbi:kinase-like protein [Mytilinidion resinicola]|uniref:Kinase-like protein n=1 Tax=Mytilinidion resinicola TaxID=574789 RepID=A0A6A6Z6R9_9PEZI|nr:kinase-like protein [Mytilinidion resinicola]KAF2815994.1 kinase-like protein [Mytilinidion resinicola]